MGAVLNNNWIMQQWPSTFIRLHDPSIEFLELYALAIALLRWRREPCLMNARVVIFCNNESVVYMANKLASNCPQCMKLLRIIALESITCNRKVIVKHIKSEDNVLSNSLSRLNLKRFWRYAPVSMNRYRDDIKEIDCMWPMQKLWQSDHEYLPTFQL